VEKSISHYTVASGAGNTNGWYFIASPIYTDFTPDETMLSNTYDLYRFNPSAELEWENYKATTGNGQPLHPDFTTLKRGRGYLYANNTDVTLNFTGPLIPYKGLVENHTNGVNVYAGWNLVGNSFPLNVYVDRPFYKMNEAGTGIMAVEEYWNTDNYIAPCTGFFVNADADGVVWLTKDAPTGNNKGSLQIVLSQVVEPVETPVNRSDGPSTSSGTLTLDNAIVSFNEGSTLPKFRFGDNAEIYIPQNGEDYAIAFSEGQGEMPVNFKANADGQYTLTVNPEGVEMIYLHLIDNLTGADVDLLAGVSTGSTTSYTFTAKTTDYESRFKLVFATNNDGDGPSTGSGTFAFFSNGNWIISNDGEATLQVIDVTGRILSSESMNGSVSKAINATPGVYMLRLINGDDVRTQRIVVR
jgi:hypothetical protein